MSNQTGKPDITNNILSVQNNLYHHYIFNDKFLKLINFRGKR